MALSIKKLALDQLCEQLRGMGIDDAKIATARAECDKPGADDSALRDLFMENMPSELRAFFPSIK